LLEDDIKKAAANHDKIIVVEMNDGQYRGEIQRILKQDVISLAVLGGTIKLEEIKEQLKQYT
jgi:pyruvate/2-oxoacid:ferredoxin oxidoreductase alpha subunit